MARRAAWCRGGAEQLEPEHNDDNADKFAFGIVRDLLATTPYDESDREGTFNE